MGYYSRNAAQKLVPSAVIAAAAWAVSEHVGPVMVNAAINWPAVAVIGIGVIASFSAASALCAVIADGLEWGSSHIPKNYQKNAGWASWREIKKDLITYGWGPYWGVYRDKLGRKRPVFANYISAFTLGPTGTGKTSKVAVNTILSLVGMDSW